MKSKSIFKLTNNFINDENENSIEENSYDDSKSERAITIRRFNIDEIQDNPK